MTANFGNGQMEPQDAGSEYNVLSFIVQQALARTRTMVLVKIKAVTNDGGVSPVGFVDVQPLVSMLDGAGTATPHETIFNLPYTRIQGGANAIILDPQVDDIGWAAIADRDISSVKATKAEAPPGSLRRFDLADGVYVGGILNGVPTQYVRFTEDEIEFVSPTKIKITAPIVEIDGSAAINVTGPLNIVGNTAVEGNLSITGSLAAAAAAFSGAMTGISLALTGALTAASGTFTGAIGALSAAITNMMLAGSVRSTGTVVAGFGGGDQVGLQSHTHAYASGNAGVVNTPAPNAGS